MLDINEQPGLFFVLHNKLFTSKHSSLSSIIRKVLSVHRQKFNKGHATFITWKYPQLCCFAIATVYKQTVYHCSLDL